MVLSWRAAIQSQPSSHLSASFASRLCRSGGVTQTPRLREGAFLALLTWMQLQQVIASECCGKACPHGRRDSRHHGDELRRHGMPECDRAGFEWMSGKSKAWSNSSPPSWTPGSWVQASCLYDHKRQRPGPARPHSAIFPKMLTTAILFHTQHLAPAHFELKLSPAERPTFCCSEKQRNESRLCGCDCQARPVTRKLKSGCWHLPVSHS